MFGSETRSTYLLPVPHDEPKDWLGEDVNNISGYIKDVGTSNELHRPSFQHSSQSLTPPFFYAAPLTTVQQILRRYHTHLSSFFISPTLSTLVMKAFTTGMFALLVLATGIKAAVVESADATVTSLTAGSGPSTDGALDVSPCYWDGTAPFCAGGCSDGYVDCGRDSCGNGACCVTGIKVYCCREDSGQC
ncbi:hypothetical protein GY45DRAFT_1372990 [Cubamyces sp. BRFM 1775]|nr:hypothetical protein GY45DRAFT_1372990 [Cubamyces sp. BRFM 1775]